MSTETMNLQQLASSLQSRPLCQLMMTSNELDSNGYPSHYSLFRFWDSAEDLVAWIHKQIVRRLGLVGVYLNEMESGSISFYKEEDVDGQELLRAMTEVRFEFCITRKQDQMQYEELVERLRTLFVFGSKEFVSTLPPYQPSPRYQARAARFAQDPSAVQWTDPAEC